MAETSRQATQVATGIKGLDYVLRGGLPKGWIHLLYGGPGTGKTTFGLQFLMEGVRCGERTLCVTLLQSKAELELTAESHGWSLDSIHVAELPVELRHGAASEQTLFETADVELTELSNAILHAIKEHRPQRLLLDSVTQFSMLVESSYHLRRQLLRIKDELFGLECTSIFTLAEPADPDLALLQTLVTGSTRLLVDSVSFGSDRRRLHITKIRGRNYFNGYHDYEIVPGGLEVFPRLQLDSASKVRDWKPIASGNDALDALVGGGLEAGTSCLVTGTTGSGKTTICTLYIDSAARSGKRSIVFCFDEGRETFVRRSEAVGTDITKYIEEGLVDLHQIDIGTVSPGRFMHLARRAVERDGVEIVVIDSLAGLITAMPGDQHVVAELHELVRYLCNAGTLFLMASTSHGILRELETPMHASYLADTILLTRHFEAEGSLRWCVSVIKKRHGKHERTIREMQITENGLRVGPPLHEFVGVLSGLPSYEGRREQLLQMTDDPEASAERGTYP